MAMQGMRQAFFTTKRDRGEWIHELYASGRFCANDIAEQLYGFPQHRNQGDKSVQVQTSTNPPSKVVAISIWRCDKWSKFIARKERVQDYVDGKCLVSKKFQIVEASAMAYEA